MIQQNDETTKQRSVRLTSSDLLLS